jgi:hypothetical protein
MDKENIDINKENNKNINKFILLNPLLTCNNNQIELINKLKNELLTLSLNEYKLNFIKNEKFLEWKFLRGYEWNYNLAKNKLLEMLEWRFQYKPEDIRIKDLKFRNLFVSFQYGVDKFNQPILHIIPRNDTIKNSKENMEEKFKHLVYSYEMARRISKKFNTIQCILIIDLKGASYSISTMNKYKKILDDLAHYYCEFVSKIIVLNIPKTLFWLSTIFKVLSENVKKKYLIMKGKENENKERLSKVIDPKYILHDKEKLDYNEKEDLEYENLYL